MSEVDAAPAANESLELLVLLENVVVTAANPPRVTGMFEPFVPATSERTGPSLSSSAKKLISPISGIRAAKQTPLRSGASHGRLGGA
jgi:hypothetical protein